MNKQYNKAIKVILNEVSKFIEAIIKDSCNDYDNWSYKIEHKSNSIFVYICDGSTKQIACKEYSLIYFMELCSKRKIEFELNKVIKEMILKIERCDNTSNKIISI